MVRLRSALLCLATVAVFPSPSTAQEAPPSQSGLVEKVEVRLVIMDVQVLDRKGKPVSGLTRGDFDLTVDGRPVPLATFDVSCPESPGPGTMVLVFDYQHLDVTQRGYALDLARGAIERGVTRDSTIMIAALTGSLQIETPFTPEHARVLSGLEAMRDDISLWAGDFSHLNEHGFMRGFTSLFDVLATIPGSKAVVLFSAMTDVPFEQQFRQLAALAAAARCVIYPVDVRGLRPLDIADNDEPSDPRDSRDRSQRPPDPASDPSVRSFRPNFPVGQRGGQLDAPVPGCG